MQYVFESQGVEAAEKIRKHILSRSHLLSLCEKEIEAINSEASIPLVPHADGQYLSADWRVMISFPWSRSFSKLWLLFDVSCWCPVVNSFSIGDCSSSQIHSLEFSVSRRESRRNQGCAALSARLWLCWRPAASSSVRDGHPVT